MGNAFDSIVFDLLKVATIFGVMDEVSNMARWVAIWSKDAWRKKLWVCARDLDDCFWRVEVRCHRNLDMLSRICG